MKIKQHRTRSADNNEVHVNRIDSKHATYYYYPYWKPTTVVNN